MRVILLMLTCALSGSNSSLIEATRPAKASAFEPAKVVNPKVSITFTGTIESIEPLGKRALKVIPVDFDSSFALIIQIDSVSTRETSLKAGRKAVFAIHSQARLFPAEKDVIGKKYRFKLNWEKVSNTSRFSQLAASSIEEDSESSRIQP